MLGWGVLSVGATPAAQRVRQCKFGGASRPWLPRWGSWRAISEPERAWAVANMGKCGDCCRVPSQSRLSAVTALPKGEPRGGLRPPSLVQHNLPNRVTPSGVGQLPGPQARHCQRGHPAVLTFCTPSPARLPIYRQCTPPRLPGRWESGWGSGATCGSRSLWLSGGRCPGRSGRSGRPGRRG